MLNYVFHTGLILACPRLTSLVQLSTKGPPNIAAIQSQLEMSKGLWAMIVPSSSLKTTSATQKWELVKPHLHRHPLYFKLGRQTNTCNDLLSPEKVPLAKHSLTLFVRRTWKALVISWFMKASLLSMFATIIRRSKTSSSSAMWAMCISSFSFSSSWPVYK